MAAKPMDLELLREIFKDDRLHIAVGKILELHMASDRSVLRVKVALFPDNHELIARMSWDAIGGGGGFIQLPKPEDMVLIGQAEGEVDQAFVIRKLSSKADQIPEEAAGHDLVAKALPGQKARMISDTAVWLSKPGATPTENLVLGQQLKTLLSYVLAELADLSLKVSTHTHIGNFGYATSAPIEVADFVQKKVNFETKKASPVDDSAILSDLSFTEKGS